MKYFLMGAFATGFLVYGMALVYGTTGGELSYAGIAAKVGEAAKTPVFFLGEYFILIALAFKVAAVPFHMWAPDAYEGAPTPVTGFMAAGREGGGVRRHRAPAGHGVRQPAAGLRLHRLGLDPVGARGADHDARQPGGAAPGEHQAPAGLLVDRARRLPADRRGRGRPGRRQRASRRCSSTWSPTPSRRWARSAWWPGSATARTSGCSSTTGRASARARPAVALAMTIFLLSLGGVPPTGGFFGKFYLFRAAMESPQLYWLVVVGVLNSVVSVYYYLRIVVAMYFRDALRPLAPTDGVVDARRPADHRDRRGAAGRLPKDRAGDHLDRAQHPRPWSGAGRPGRRGDRGRSRGSPPRSPAAARRPA